MLKRRASEGPAELQCGSTLIRETPGVRQSYSCVSLQRHRLSVICKTHNVYCSPLSMAKPRNLSCIFAEGAYYARILICETPRDSQCDRSSPVGNTLNREPCSADHLGCITRPIQRIVERVVICLTVVISPITGQYSESRPKSSQ